MKKYIPFELFVPEEYMSDDLSISLLPVNTSVDNPYSVQGDILIAVMFSEETDILKHLTNESFIIFQTDEGLHSMRLKVEDGVYTFLPLTAQGMKPIVKLKENIFELAIVGKVIFSFHDFADLTNPNINFREILSFPEQGVDFPD